MRRAISLALVLLVPVLLCTPELATAQKAKGKDAMDKDGDAKNTPKSMKGGVIVGRITNVYEDKRKIQLSVPYQATSIDTGAIQQVAQAQQQMAQAQYALRTARDINGINQARQQMIQAQVQLAQAQARIYKVENKTKEGVEILAIDDVEVRSAQIKEVFDEKGVLKKKFSKEELEEELKGDPKLPGYKATFADLQVDQWVRVTLVRKAAVKPPPAKKGKKGGDDEIGDAIGLGTPEAMQIYILRQPTPGK